MIWSPSYPPTLYVYVDTRVGKQNISMFEIEFIFGRAPDVCDMRWTTTMTTWRTTTAAPSSSVASQNKTNSSDFHQTLFIFTQNPNFDSLRGVHDEPKRVRTSTNDLNASQIDLYDCRQTQNIRDMRHVWSSGLNMWFGFCPYQQPSDHTNP